MAVVEVLMALVSLWLASSVIALIALVGLYLAERARTWDSTAVTPAGGTTVPHTGDAGRPRGAAGAPSRPRAQPLGGA